ncbi:hypothetical protein C1J03_16495 [Sulfitobacter sp. SK012]|uniref:hypothetical protein n=1 Tax=Sulfitobacter sp. SK012 TaxID=1389005 RepID=UPI000E0A0778|nr:hypothetical protein [Sulfitobacter sp. SK012]AXI47465.1 hypothetical protein C1J03_16495 [Sulfitobacter sp. SK012]
MKHVVATLALLISVPAHAQDAPSTLMERGAQMFLEGLLNEMAPALDDLSEFAEEMGPFLRDFATKMGPKLHELMGEVEDWSAYSAPEMLPNGDIIIRRKPDHPLDPVTPTVPAPQVDL